MKSLLRKLGWWLRRRQRDADLQEELLFHLEEEAGEQQATGLSSRDARLAARRDLGNPALLHEETRNLWTWTLWEQFAQDARYSLRTMAANKVFSALAILSLALGIGANTAIFSFMDSILLRSLPVPDPESLVTLSWHTNRVEVHGSNRHDDSIRLPDGGFIGGFFAYPAFEMFRRDREVFSAVFGYQGAGNLYVTADRQTEVTDVEYVSGDYFQGIGIAPGAGRLIAPEDDRAGAPSVAVISFGMSQRRFGGPGGALGRTIQINNFPFNVIGVAPPEFFGADPDAFPEVYVPMHANLLFDARDRFYPPAGRYANPDFDWVVIMARLRPGITAAQAQAALSGQFSDYERTQTTKRSRTDLAKLVVRNSAGGLDGLRRRYSKPLYILLTLVGLILSIACANIANLLLARAAARKREIALRLSIGAGRFRVIRQLLTESVILASLGGALGIAFALWGIRSLTVLLANGRDNFTLRAELNWHVLGVVAALSLITGVLFGLAPALQSTRVDLMPALKQSRTGRSGSHGFRRLTLSRILMVSQIALTLVILVAAALFVRTLSNLESIQLGFNRENVLVFKLNARQAQYADREILSLYSDLRRRFAALPGIRSAAFSDSALIGYGTSMTGVSISGGKRVSSLILSAGPGFFATMQIPILLGREIDERDRPGSPLVAVVNQAFVKSYLADRNPIGLRISLPYECARCDIEIVGVSGNARYGQLTGEVEPTLYLPFGLEVWGPIGAANFELRTAGNPLAYARAVRETVRQADDRVPVSNLTTQGALIDGTINQEVAFARLCSLFALLALVIACVGLYGSMSYTVARRKSEIGIRMALGAQRGKVVWIVLREVLMLAATGLVISLPAALAASRLIQSFLYDTKPGDPLALAASIATVVTAAVVAGYLPARNASRIAPMEALRHE
jgi:predicted permease